MLGFGFRLPWIAGLLGVVLGAHLAPAATSDDVTTRGPAWSRTSSATVR